MNEHEKTEVKTGFKTPRKRQSDIARREDPGSQEQRIPSPCVQPLHLQKTMGNQVVQRLLQEGILQAKLSIGQPNDIYEQEADRVADRVMAMPDPGVKRQSEEEEEKVLPLRMQPEGKEDKPRQARESAAATPEVDPGLEADIHALQGSGQPLPSAVRDHFEPRFDHDFSQVQIHRDQKAARLADAVHAKAFTLGDNVVFGAGQYAPETESGKRLLAHELTHVVQQSGNVQSDSRGAKTGPELGVEPVAGPSAQRLDRELDDFSVKPLSPTVNSLQRKGADAGVTTEHIAGTLWAKDEAGKDLPPSLDDIAQRIADCFLFAALAAIVVSDPQKIVNMIRDNGNGTYTVTFKGIGFFSSDEQTVSADFEVGKHGATGKRKALWPLIIEKAYAQEKGGIAELEKGGNAGSVVEDLLNVGPSRFDPREKSADYIMGKLATAKEKKWPMTILTPKQGDATEKKKMIAEGTPGLHFWHFYAIIDVDGKNNKIKLFNPWGYDHPNGDGWITIDLVRKFFIEIDIND